MNTNSLPLIEVLELHCEQIELTLPFPELVILSPNALDESMAMLTQIVKA